MSSDITALRAIFESQGISNNDLVSKEALYDLVTRLNGHEDFDEDVFNEIWEQCKEDSLGKVEIREFIDVTFKARHILNNRVIESKRKLQELEQLREMSNDRFNKQTDDSIKRGIQRQINQIDQQIRSLEQTIVDSTIDFDVLNKPFFRQSTSYRQSAQKPRITTSEAVRISIPDFPSAEYTQLPSSAEQRLLFAFAILGLFMQIMINYSKIGFLNLLSYTMIFGFYALQKVPKNYWIISISLLACSLPIDIAWMALYSPFWWSRPMEHLNSVGFQRYCIIMTSLLLLLKAYATVLLFIGFRPKQSDRSSRFI